MALQPDRLRYLLQQYLADRCTREELEELYAAVPSEKTSDMEALLDEAFAETQPGKGIRGVDWDGMFHRIVKEKPVTRVRRLSYWKYVAAAIVLLVAGAGVMYLSVRPVNDRGLAINTPLQKVEDVAPGTNKAILTLGNGTQVALDSTGNKMLKQGSTAIHQQGGSLQYNAQNNNADITYNTLTTPRGGQFQVTLPDGTQVWLNAASSLKYPTAFTGHQRDVVLTGEAYFEVVHNDKMPFRVHMNGIEIKDIGTHFDVMAYNDERAIKTTLIEGAINISDGKATTKLQPGQQAVLDKYDSAGIVVQRADMEEAIAWKNGEFSFHHTSIYAIMRQVSRWYDVDIQYKDSLDTYLSGNIGKNVNVSEVFKMLELAGEVHFKIENKKATVMK